MLIAYKYEDEGIHNNIVDEMEVDEESDCTDDDSYTDENHSDEICNEFSSESY